MFVAYLFYKKSWIGLIGLLLILTNALILLDTGVSVEPDSLIYLNALFLTISIVFFIVRYKRETSYYKTILASLNEIDDDWFESIPSSQSRFPDQTIFSILETIHDYEQNRRNEDHSSQQMDQAGLASWVHEMKTPLTAMKIILDGHRLNELAQKLNAPWLRMHLLLDRQLYISRLPELDSDLLPEKQAVQDIMKEEIRELSTWFMEKNISIELTGNSDATVYTDKKWCGFMMRQILTNGIQYSPTGGKIYIDMRLDEDKFVSLTIKDEGPGIQTHDLPRIFDKGFTGENGRLHHSATGMGLYLAKEISKKLQIKLDVDSSVGEGTRFLMRFSHDNPFESIRRSAV